MKILYDYQVLTNRVSGASRAFCEVGKRLSCDNEVRFEYLFSENVFLKEIFGEYRPFLRGINFKGKSFINKKLQESYCKRIISKSDFDIFHSTGEEIYFDKLLEKPFITTFHDMIPENFLQNSPRISNRKKLTEIADRIVCVSQNTKNELLQAYPALQSNKVDVVYHGIDKENIIYGNNNYGEYILFVGVCQSHKNFLMSMEAIIPLLIQYEDIKVLCTGNAFTKQELDFMAKYKLVKRILNVGFVSNNELFTLYKYALLFLFPSLYEGFGIPILEAFVNECPACISNTSCFPEIGGDAVSYFDPKNKESILDSVKKVLENHVFAENLKKKGNERVLNFTWEKSAESMLTVYEKALI